MYLFDPLPCAAVRLRFEVVDADREDKVELTQAEERKVVAL